ncbi:hypothetical protein PtA15_2A927 [Puccinia triticina]|uniref:Uncharacterized protein n=1 Tax=Puccinia triticina TaxID=208348 RepID=A0ABY7CFJ3_9BASI|nr:uncharacterized protein PtA15_2A927 [Puccinia triticina]WAQ82610.1 hypothetical protein PtA15_2A927 [Puccinia triticina]
MNPVARPRHATSYDPYSYSSTHEDERSSPPGEPTGGILTATCDTLLAFKHPFIPRPQTPSPNGIDSVEREEVSNAAPSCLLAPAKSHVTTELGALKTGALAARSRLKVVDRCQPAPDQPQGSTEPGNEATNSTGSGLDATTHGEIAWFQHSEAAHNVRLRVVQPVEIADGDEQGQTGSSGVIAAMGPATAGRSEELNISPASTSSSLLSGDKNRDVKVVSAPSSSYLVSPLAEVTDAYTGLQGGWGLPSLTPGFDLKHQHIPHATDCYRRTSQKPSRVKNVDKKGNENKSIDANYWNPNQMPSHHRTRRGQGSRNNSSADQSTLPSVPRGPLRI